MHAIERPRPRTELLAVVRVHLQLRARRVPLPQLLERGADVSERDEVPQAHAPREHDDRKALILGNEGRTELVPAQASLEEVLLVEDRVRDARLRQERRHVRLPHALGQPGTQRAVAEDLNDAVRQGADLPHGVAARDPDQDRLEVAPCQELDLAAAQQVQVVKIGHAGPVSGGIAHIGDKVVGDVERGSVENKIAFLSPVPGGVGPVTVASLLARVTDAALKIQK